MPYYPWYEIIQNHGDITQGDIIKDCYIPMPNEQFYFSLLKGDKTVSGPINVSNTDVIILSQACDIDHAQIDSIIVCPIWPLFNLVSRSEYYKSKVGKENLRQGKEPAYHLLNEHNSGSYKMPLSIVDFHRIYSLPKDFITNIANQNCPRLRLLPPYREHLSQAFARYFMRVGLPIDIPKDKVRSIV
jgi:hypothetical protein